MTTRADPAPLFDLVTGFPPDDALDVTVPMPLTLALYMTMLESTGHAADVAALRKVHIEQARETARHLQTGSAAFTGPDLPDAARLRVTHIVEERVRGVNGLRPHVHFFVGTSVRGIAGPEGRLDVERLTAWAHDDLLADHRARLVAVTAERCGLRWGPTSWSPHEVLDPSWLVERAARSHDDELACPGPWPRNQIRVGRHRP